ncbi:MAG: NAD(P)-dependent alcohol dehydrogenase [Bifidobacterium scardovii]|uniref:NAD(P)-dependent alcohol dehydrogenase n=1 Tax=Bifidobacterium scardovii TaxID=158787 RepID=UPI0028FE0A91|nr:NAD(P)-dependent alcohol dehydrogenase [Bifidobacterium scardovii]MDU2422701.1 NAD(P)-dependent alcohol dehydrogenase [Bifidobacterium scardovii]
MKGLVYTEMGRPNVLKVSDVKKPIPQRNQILVKVKASSINSTDFVQFESAVKTGKVSALFRIKEKLKDKKLGKVLGTEFAGIVAEVGADVTGFNKGDAVYGIADGMLGAWAEYVCADSNAVCAMPETLSFEEASAVPVAGTTSLSAIRKAQIKPGQHVLVYGASGGVGQFTVQILKAYGATVTAVCSTKNVDTAWKLGADHVVDYKRENVFANEKQHDAIIAVNGFNPTPGYSCVPAPGTDGKDCGADRGFGGAALRKESASGVAGLYRGRCHR